jgi:hypothetical protein
MNHHTYKRLLMAAASPMPLLAGENPDVWMRSACAIGAETAMRFWRNTVRLDKLAELDAQLMGLNANG